MNSTELVRALDHHYALAHRDHAQWCLESRTKQTFSLRTFHVLTATKCLEDELLRFRSPSAMFLRIARQDILKTRETPTELSLC